MIVIKKITLGVILILLPAFPVHAGASDPSEVVLKIKTTQLSQANSTMQLSVTKKRSDIPWTFVLTPGDNHATTSSVSAVGSPADFKEQINRSIQRSGTLGQGLSSWPDGNGVAFQVAGASFFAGWDGTIYVKTEGRKITASISLQTNGKVVIVDGVFSQPLKVKSSSLEFPKKLTLTDFAWEEIQSNESGAQASVKTDSLTLGKDSVLEVKNFQFKGKVINYGTIKLEEGGTLRGTSLDNYGVIETKKGTIDFASINNFLNIKDTADLSLKAEHVMNQGTLESHSRLDIYASRTENKSGIIGAEFIRILGGSLTNVGKILAKFTLYVNAKAITNEKEGLISGLSIILRGDVLNHGQIQIEFGSLQVVSNTFKNTGVIASQASVAEYRFQVQNDFNNDGGNILGATVEIEAKELSNFGQILANKKMVLKSENLSNSANALLSGGGSVDIEVLRNVNNMGQILSKGPVQIGSENITNAIGALVTSSKVQIKATAGINNLGRMEGDLSFQSRSTTNGATATLTGGTLVMSVVDCSNLGQILANKSIQVKAENITNASDAFISAPSIELNAKENINNQGRMNGSARLVLQSKTATNGASAILSGNAVFLTHEGKLTNSGKIQYGKDISVAGYPLRNSGRIVPLSNDLSDVSRIQSDTFDNSGGIVEGKILEIAATQVVLGEVSASQEVRFKDRPNFSLKDGVIAAPKIELGNSQSILKGNPAWVNVVFKSKTLRVTQEEFNQLDSRVQAELIIIQRHTGQSLRITRPYKTDGSIFITDGSFAAKKMKELYGDEKGTLPSPLYTFEILASLQAKQGIMIDLPDAKVRVGDVNSAQPVELLSDGFVSVHANTFDLENGIAVANNVTIHAPVGITIGRLVRDPVKESFVTYYRHKYRNSSSNLDSDIFSVSYNLMGQDFPDVYDGHHLATLPMMAPNLSYVRGKSSVTLRGPWQHWGTLEAENLTLHTSQESRIEGSQVLVEKDLFLSGSGNLRLKRVLGTLSSSHARCSWDRSKGSSNAACTQVSSDAAKLSVKGKVSLGAYQPPTSATSGRWSSLFRRRSVPQTGQVNPIIMNEGSDFHFGQLADGIALQNTNINTSYHQLIFEGTPQQRAALNSAGGRGFHNVSLSQVRDEAWHQPGGASSFHAQPYAIDRANSFLRMTNDFDGAMNVFTANTSTPQNLIRRVNGGQISGALSADCLLVFVGSNGAVIGSANANGCQAPLPPPVRSFDTPSVINPFVWTIVSDEQLASQIASIRSGTFLPPPIQEFSVPRDVLAYSSEVVKPVLFKMHERFWFDEGKAQKFYRDIRDHVVVVTLQGEFQKPDAIALYARTPEKLLKEVSSDTIKALKREFIYHNRSMDLELLQELHRNMTEYLAEVAPRGMTGSEFQKALILRDVGNVERPLPKKPLIFYSSVRNEGGLDELHARTYFPPAMIQEAHGRGGNRILSQKLIVLPDHLSPEQMIEHFQGNPTVQDALVRVLTENEQTNRLIADNTLASQIQQGQPPFPATSTPANGSVTIYGEVQVNQVGILANGGLSIHGDIVAKEAFLASLFEDVNVESKKEKILVNGNGTFYERISQQARVHVDGILTILAGKDINFTGALTQSGTRSHFEALGSIWELPVETLEQIVTTYAEKKKRGEEITRNLKQIPSQHQSGGTLEYKAGEYIGGASTQYQAKERITFDAGQGIKHLAANNVASFESKIASKSGGVFKKEQIQQQASVSSTAVPSVYDAPVTEFRSGQQGVVLTAPVVTGDLRAQAPEGTVRINMAPNESASSSFTQKSDIAWKSAKVESAQTRTFTAPRIAGSIVIEARETVIQTIQGQTHSFMERLKQNGNEEITIEDLKELYVETSKKVQGPSQALSVVVSIAVGALTYGSGSSFATGTLKMAAKGVGQAMFAAGFSSVCAQAATGTLAHQGNFGRAAKDVCSSKGLKSTAKAVATAGLVRGVGMKLGMDPKPQGLEGNVQRTFGDHVQAALVNQGVRATLDVAMGDQSVSEALRSAARGAVVQTVGAQVANQIGEARADGTINFPTQIAAHGVLGLGLGEIMGDATAGAIGAMSAELFVESFAGDREFGSAEEVNAVADWAKLAGAMATLLADRDVGVGSMSASNAIDNNFKSTAVLKEEQHDEECSVRVVCDDESQECHAEVYSKDEGTFGRPKSACYRWTHKRSNVLGGRQRFIGRYNAVCTNEEVLRATAAVNDLEDGMSGKTVRPSVIVKDIARGGAGGQVAGYASGETRFSCAAEEITGRTISTNMQSACASWSGNPDSPLNFATPQEQESFARSCQEMPPLPTPPQRPPGVSPSAPPGFSPPMVSPVWSVQPSSRDEY